MEIFYIVVVLLILSRLGADLAERAGQPALAGELVAGVLLGVLINYPGAAFPVLGNVRDYDGFRVLTDFGMFFLMLLGGIELRPAELMKSSGRSFAIAIGGFALPLATGFGVTWAFLPDTEARFVQALFVGTALAITAVPVSVKVLMELGKLQSPIGNAIVAAALLDDIITLVLLALLTGLAQTGGVPSGGELVWLFGGAIAYLGVGAVIARFLLPWMYARLVDKMRVEELEFSALLIVALVFAVLAEVFHLHFILGPFLAGLFFGRRTMPTEVYEDVQRKVRGITSGFLAPLFFVSIGLHTDITALVETPVFFIVLLAIAFGGKIAGAAVPARLGGFRMKDATAIGVGMSGRGAVELIVADIALRSGVFTSAGPEPPVVDNMFGAIVLVAVITTIATPILLRRILRE